MDEVQIDITDTVDEVAITVTETVETVDIIVSEALQGDQGISAYQVAVEQGYSGTVDEWLLSLKGDAFEYSDFTPEQLEALKVKGDKGDAFEYSDFTSQQLADLKGDKGDAFEYEDFTPEQLAGLKGDKGEAFIYEDFTPEQIADLKGEKGDPFVYEDFTPQQIEDLKGDKGDPGTTDFTMLTNKPTELADINSTEGSKLSGIEVGANNYSVETTTGTITFTDKQNYTTSLVAYTSALSTDKILVSVTDNLEEAAFIGLTLGILTITEGVGYSIYGAINDSCTGTLVFNYKIIVL